MTRERDLASLKARVAALEAATPRAVGPAIDLVALRGALALEASRLGSQVPAEHMRPELRLTEDLGFDPLDRVELMLALEDRFDLGVVLDGAEWRTLGDVARALGRCLARAPD